MEVGGKPMRVPQEDCSDRLLKHKHLVYLDRLLRHDLVVACSETLNHNKEDSLALPNSRLEDSLVLPNSNREDSLAQLPERNSRTSINSRKVPQRNQHLWEVFLVG